MWLQPTQRHAIMVDIGCVCPQGDGMRMRSILAHDKHAKHTGYCVELCSCPNMAGQEHGDLVLELESAFIF